MKPTESGGGSIQEARKQNRHEQDIAFQAIHSMLGEQINNRLNAFSVTYTEQNPFTTAWWGVSGLPTEYVRRAGEALSRAWPWMSDLDSVYGVPGSMLAARSKALEIANPLHRQIALGFLDHLGKHDLNPGERSDILNFIAGVDEYNPPPEKAKELLPYLALFGKGLDFSKVHLVGSGLLADLHGVVKTLSLPFEALGSVSHIAGEVVSKVPIVGNPIRLTAASALRYISYPIVKPLTEAGHLAAESMGLKPGDPGYDDVVAGTLLIGQYATGKLLGGPLRGIREGRMGVLTDKTSLLGDLEELPVNNSILRKRFGRLGALAYRLATRPVEKWVTMREGKAFIKDVQRIIEKTPRDQVVGKLTSQIKNLKPDLAARLAATDGSAAEISAEFIDHVKNPLTAGRRLYDLNRRAQIEQSLADPALNADEVAQLKAEKLEINDRLGRYKRYEPQLIYPKPRGIRAFTQRMQLDAPRTKLEAALSFMYNPKEFKTPILRTLNPALRFGAIHLSRVFDSLARERLRLWFTGNPQVDAAALSQNAKVLTVFLNRLGMPRQYIQELIGKMTKVKWSGEMNDWLDELSSYIGDHANFVYPGMKARLVEGLRNEGSIPTHVSHYVKLPDGTEMPLMDARQQGVPIRDVVSRPVVADEMGRPMHLLVPDAVKDISLPSGELMAEATSAIRAVRRSLNKTKAGRAAVGVFYELPKELSALATSIFKYGGVLIARMPTVILKTQLEQGFGRVPFSFGYKPLVRYWSTEYKKFAFDNFVTPESIGAIFRESFIPATERSVVAANPLRDGGKSPGWGFIVERLTDLHKTPEARKLVEFGGDVGKTLNWLKTDDYGRTVLESRRVELEKANHTPEQYLGNLWNEMRELTFDRQDLMDTVRFGRSPIRAASAEDAVAASEVNVEALRRAQDELDSLGKSMEDATTPEVRKALSKQINSAEKQILVIEKKVSRDNRGELLRLPDALEGPRRDIRVRDYMAAQLRELSETKNDAGVAEYVPPPVVEGDPTSNVASRLLFSRRLRMGLQDRMFRMLSPYSKADITRRSLYYQLAKEKYDQLRRIKMSDRDATAFAKVYAAAETKDWMYDLAARTSAQRYLSNVFWFAPAWQELMTTWMFKIPGQYYWPAGMVLLGGRLMALHDALAELGKHHIFGIHTVPQVVTVNGKKVQKNVEVIGIPGMSSWFATLLGATGIGSGLYVDNKNNRMFGISPQSFNLITGLPGLSFQYNLPLGYASHHNSFFKGISHALQPFGSDVLWDPYPVQYLWEAITGKPIPWEPNKALSEQVYNTGMDDAVAAAIKEEGLGKLPSDPMFYRTNAAGESVFQQGKFSRYSERYLGKIMSTAQDIYRGRAWMRLVGTVTGFGSWRVIDQDKTDAQKFWSTYLAAASPEKRQQVFEDYLADHPRSIGYMVSKSVLTGKGPLPKKLLADLDQNDKAYFDQVREGWRRVLPPEEYAAKTYLVEAYRLLQHDRYVAYQDIVPGVDPNKQPDAFVAGLLTHGTERHTATDQYAQEFENFLRSNEAVHVGDKVLSFRSMLEDNRRVWLRGEKAPTATLEIDQLETARNALRRLGTAETTDIGTTPQEIRNALGTLNQTLAEKGTYGKPQGPLARAFAWYSKSILTPYYTELQPLIEEMQYRQARGISVDDVAQKIKELKERYTANTQDRTYNGVVFPTPEQVAWGNMIHGQADQQELRLHWSSLPPLWLTSFQRGKVGYSTDASLDEFSAKVQVYDQQLKTYEQAHAISTTSKAGEYLQSRRDAQLLAIANGYGSAAVDMLKLQDASPFERLNYLGFQIDVPGGVTYDQNNPEWTKVSQAAQWATTYLAQHPGVPGLTTYLQGWFFNAIDKERKSHQDLDSILHYLGYALPTDKTDYREDRSLYSALFFGDFFPSTIEPGVPNA